MDLRVPPSSPLVRVSPARKPRRTTTARRRRRQRVQPEISDCEALDADDDARLLKQVLASSYNEYVRPRMPISYLKGTSMMKHDPAPDRKALWCHPHKTLKPSIPVWDRPVTAAERIVSPGRTPKLTRPRSQAASRVSSRQARQRSAGSGSGGAWSQRSSTDSVGTVRNGTSLNMPSFKRLPKGHPQSILYSALHPHMPISHIQRPGSAQATSGVWKMTRSKHREVPTATLRAGFQPKYRQVLLPFEPQDASTYLSTTKRSFTKQESDEYRKHIAPELEREHHMRCGEFSNYLTEAILKKVEYYKVGH